MVVKRKDFQKAAAFIHEFLLKLNEDIECAELRDTLNLALLYMQKYYKLQQTKRHEKNGNILPLSARGMSPMTPFVDAPDKFLWKWINLDSPKVSASFNVDDSYNFTTLPPLIQAVKEGDTERIAELINEDPSCAKKADGIGRTPLMYAVHYCQLESLNCLLDYQAEVTATANDDSTVIHLACHEDNYECLCVLLECGGDFTLQDTYGRAPIHWTVTTDGIECLKVMTMIDAIADNNLLIQFGADVNVTDNDGLTPSMWACRLDHIQHFELLSQSETAHNNDSGDIEVDRKGLTWLHWAVRRTEPLECLQTLLTVDSAMYQDKEGKTVLHTAAEQGSLPACKLILEIAGVDRMDDADTLGRTPLHLAAMGGHGEVINFLLEHQADLGATDNSNATAWDYARSRQLHYCQLIIMSHQRQRLASNPNSPMPNGFGPFDSQKMFNGSFDPDHDDEMLDVQKPVTPPHPPKRPRTGKIQLGRRTHSLTTTPNPDQSGQQRHVISADGVRKERPMAVPTRPIQNTSEAFISNGHGPTVVMPTDHMEYENDSDNMNEVESVEVGELGLSDDMEDESPPDAGPRAQPNQQSRPTPSPRVHPQPASRYMYRQRPSEQQQHATQQMQGQMYAQPPSPQHKPRGSQNYEHQEQQDVIHRSPSPPKRSAPQPLQTVPSLAKQSPNPYPRTAPPTYVSRGTPSPSSDISRGSSAAGSPTPSNQHSRPNSGDTRSPQSSAKRPHYPGPSGVQSPSNQFPPPGSGDIVANQYPPHVQGIQNPTNQNLPPAQGVQYPSNQYPQPGIQNTANQYPPQVSGGQNVSNQHPHSGSGGMQSSPNQQQARPNSGNVPIPLSPPTNQLIVHPGAPSQTIRQAHSLQPIKASGSGRGRSQPRDPRAHSEERLPWQPQEPASRKGILPQPLARPSSNTKPTPIPRPNSGHQEDLSLSSVSSHGGGDGQQKGIDGQAIDTQERPSSSQNRPPAGVDGKRIPPPVLTPLRNAPLPPSARDRKRKKKKRRERDLPSTGNALPPPVGFGAPLQPPPAGPPQPWSEQRDQSASQHRGPLNAPPPPRYSKSQPQRHEPRFSEEQMEDDSNAPVVNGYAVPIRENPVRSARPGQRSQPMEVTGHSPNRTGGGDGPIPEDTEVGPLIPPPQAFRGPGPRYPTGQGRPLSQSIPQDNRPRPGAGSAKPPLPRGRGGAVRNGAGTVGPTPGIKQPRPPTGRSGNF